MASVKETSEARALGLQVVGVLEPPGRKDEAGPRAADGRARVRRAASARTGLMHSAWNDAAQFYPPAAFAATLAGRKSMPSGLSRNPGSRDATSAWPYCQTI
jgi:hypothetical protein